MSGATQGNGRDLPEDVTAINPQVAHMARIYDYLLGGSVNFAVDREVAEESCAVLPDGIQGARRNVRANRDFLVRVVRELAADRGVRQFLDLGTGIPNADNVHAVAQQTAPDARIVYVDHDPVVLAHAHELLRNGPEDGTAFLLRDVRDTERLLHDAAATLDFDLPVAVIAAGILHYLADDAAYGLVERLGRQTSPGSWLVVTHLANDVDPEAMAALERKANDAAMAEETSVFRSQAEVARFLDGLEVIDPGVVGLDRWVETDGVVVPIYGAVGYKPHGFDSVADGARG